MGVPSHLVPLEGHEAFGVRAAVRTRRRAVLSGLGQQHYDHTALAFGFACRVVYDETGLLLRYPGIAIPAA